MRLYMFIEIIITILVSCSALDAVFNSVIEESGSCNTACDKTYSLPSFTGSHVEACKRGCRFFSIGDVINDKGDINVTKNACDSSCDESYPVVEEREACNNGCSSQMTITQQKPKQDEPVFEGQDMFSPLLYMQSLCGGLMGHMSNVISVSWSYYVQEDNGKVIMVQSSPQILTSFDDTDDSLSLSSLLGEPSDTRKNTKKEPMSSGYLYHLQDGGRPLEDMLVRRGETNPRPQVDLEEEIQTMDWLGCVSRKSGLPRWFLAMTIFLSSFVMIWLCFATTATAPEHKIQTQKVNYLTDVDYMQYYEPTEQIKYQPINEQDAPPLPVKVHLNKL